MGMFSYSFNDESVRDGNSLSPQGLEHNLLVDETRISFITASHKDVDFGFTEKRVARSI